MSGKNNEKTTTDNNKSNISKTSKTPSIEEQFKKKSLHEHILDPNTSETYIGSIHNDIINIYVYDDDENKIVRRDKHIILGLYKIFDEVLVNASDNTVRDKKCNRIEVNIDEESGEISVWNNGSTIPIEIHKDYNIYVPELIFGNLLTSGNYDRKGKTVGGKNGFGAKCICSETLVPLYDGRIKMAKDIIMDDKLIGDDGKIRNINKIIKGNGQMYEITQDNGEKYKVNEQHILTLHMPDHKKIFWNDTENSWSVLWWNNIDKCINKKSIVIKKRKNNNIDAPNTIQVQNALKELEKFCEQISELNVFDISIQEYMSLSDTTKKHLAGIRGECVEWDKKQVNLDPYVLGLWLGDGFSKEYEENDIEIIKYLEDWNYENNDEIDSKSRCFNSITLEDNFVNKNHSLLTTKLREYNLLNNKHIPIDYIVNDRGTRLKLLAGIIDTNGYLSRDSTRIRIYQGMERKQLIYDIVLLARSLGFYCSINTKNDNYNLNISGNIEDIPTLLLKKKCSNRISKSNKSTGFINISNIGNGDYIGFEIDSNQRFVVNDFTVTHNCANIYSTRFDVEICDPVRKKKYFQRFTNNMFDKEEPVITSIDKHIDSYTKITFVPDYKKFNLKNITSDMISLMKRRVYDIAGTTNQSVNVWLNGKHLDIKSFKDYIQMFYDEENMPELIYEEFNERWSLGIIYDPNAGFQHMTFVNKISTFKGGTHLNYITNQIVDKVIENILSQPKYKSLKIKPHQIKENLTIFINSVIEDPSFSSQTKEELTTKSSLFNIKCELDDKFIGKICKTGLVNEIVQIAQIKQMDALGKSDGKKNANLKTLTKLDDAKLAGSKRASECTLILTEGDSAKTFAISGLEIIGRDLYGVFPLKGKLLNVRDATPNQLLSNEEIKNLKYIMGLKQNTVYNDTKKLRYGHILILTDQDVDGSHIKGLLMNFFHYFWPSLLKIDGFIQSIATPIVKVYKNSDTKKQNPEIFYTLTEYKKWCEKQGDNIGKKFKIKYFKGLGTSTASEAKESFTEFESKLINYVWTTSSSTNTTKLIDKTNLYDDIDEDLESSKSAKSEDKSDNVSSISDNIDKNEPSYQAMTLAFAKSRADDRKEWVRQRDENLIVENNIKKIPIYDFVNKDLIHFSYEDNIRSIPDLIDGLKPSQRKILYGAFKRKLDHEEIKVAQLSGYISEHTGYHHGEASLQGAIINMAQDFCGSNNIHLLYPSGNFGTRRLGGKDAASPRYIFTQLSCLARNIFITKDEPILEQVIEEGDVVEPVRYYPIIPMLLVNGSEGIGTGFSTFIPPYNPIDLVANIKSYLTGTSGIKLKELTPWYFGFTGRIEKFIDKKNCVKYISHGIFEQIDEYTLRITELPIGVWTQNYIDFLSKLIEDDGILTDYENNCGNHKIDFKLYFKNGELQKLIKTKSIEEKLKLTSSIQVSNMHVYKNNVIVKYSNPNLMLADYCDIRLEFYAKRKEHYIKVLENELRLLKYRRKFILQVISNQLIISKKQKSALIEELEELEYPELSTSVNSKPSYDYLVGMPMWSLTQEKIDELESDYNNKKSELETYKNTPIQDLWLGELTILENQLKHWFDTKLTAINESGKASKKNSKSSKSIKSEKSNNSKTISVKTK